MLYMPINGVIVQNSTNKGSREQINSQSMDHTKFSNVEILHLDFDSRICMRVVKIVIKVSPGFRFPIYPPFVGTISWQLLFHVHEW